MSFGKQLKPMPAFVNCWLMLYADVLTRFTKQSQVFMTLGKKPLENIVGKGEDVGFPTVFYSIFISNFSFIISLYPQKQRV